MPRVYRLETERSRLGPFLTDAAWDIKDVALRHGRDIEGDLPSPDEDPPIDEAMSPSRHVRFGFARIKDYEWWTKHEEVRKAFADWRSKDGERLRFNVYEVPALVAKSRYQAIFDKGAGLLIESRDPAEPRKRNSAQEAQAA